MYKAWVLTMPSKSIHLKLSPQLLEKIDRAARANLNSRSGFIRESVIMRLNNQHLAHNPRPDDILELLRQAKSGGGSGGS
jgi:metal-responsive CopG/Arc/MetJ family transcriptional regulator